MCLLVLTPLDTATRAACASGASKASRRTLLDKRKRDYAALRQSLDTDLGEAQAKFKAAPGRDATFVRALTPDSGGTSPDGMRRPSYPNRRYYLSVRWQ